MCSQQMSNPARGDHQLNVGIDRIEMGPPPQARGAPAQGAQGERGARRDHPAGAGTTAALSVYHTSRPPRRHPI